MQLTIVTPTHNRSVQLAKGLRALNQQSWPTTQFEVIVVADACTDDTEAMVRAITPDMNYPLRLFSHTAKSAAATRNLGAQHACGATLLFMDDDIIPSPDFIKVHMQSQQANGVVLGYSKPVLPTKADWWQLGARLWWEDAFRAMRQPDHRFSYRDFFSGNVSMPAALFQKVGGFDASIRGRLEDYELGMRLQKAGVIFQYVPTALGYHHDQTDFRRWVRRLHQEGVADVQIGDRYPELRHTMFKDFEDALRDAPRLKRLLHRLAYRHPRLGAGFIACLLVGALLAERLRLRGARQRINGVLRDLAYWLGVVSQLGGMQKMTGWLQEAPLLPGIAHNAPLVEMLALPAPDELQSILQTSSSLGLRVCVGSEEVLTVAPQVGAEPLRVEHLHQRFQEFAKNRFIPALALHYLITSEQVNVKLFESQ